MRRTLEGPGIGGLLPVLRSGLSFGLSGERVGIVTNGREVVGPQLTVFGTLVVYRVGLGWYARLLLVDGGELVVCFLGRQQVVVFAGDLATGRWRGRGHVFHRFLGDHFDVHRLGVMNVVGFAACESRILGCRLLVLQVRVMPLVIQRIGRHVNTTHSFGRITETFV
jgi:hypothetical protein